MKKLIFLLTCFLLWLPKVFSQELTIYVIPAPLGIDWGSPRDLFLSYASNLLATKGGAKRHSMGHVLVELKDHYNYALVGAAPRGKLSMNSKVLAEGYGLGAFNCGFPGKLEEAEENMPDLQERMRKGKVAYIRIMLSPELFSHLWSYMEEYRERGYHRVYNGGNRPRYGEGAGCSAYAISFLELGEFPMEEVLRDWQVSVPVPATLVGGPATSGRRFVHPARILRAFSWADTLKEGYRTVSYYEPTRMYASITGAWDSCIAYAGGVREMKRNSRGFRYDMRSRAVPATPVWLGGWAKQEYAVKSRQIKFD